MFPSLFASSGFMHRFSPCWSHVILIILQSSRFTRFSSFIIVDGEGFPPERQQQEIFSCSCWLRNAVEKIGVKETFGPESVRNIKKFAVYDLWGTTARIQTPLPIKRSPFTSRASLLCYI